MQSFVKLFFRKIVKGDFAAEKPPLCCHIPYFYFFIIVHPIQRPRVTLVWGVNEWGYCRSLKEGKNANSYEIYE